MTNAARGYAQFIDIDQPPGRVFLAFTRKELLERWIALEASVDARRGGSLRLKLRDGRVRDAVIDVYEPDRRLRLIYMPDRSLPSTPGSGPLIEDVLFDAKRSHTVVRVMASGVPEGPQWDAHVAWLRQAWAYWLHSLKRFVEAPPAPAAGA
jgi:uncharacterized protein YndB with AHSA1/START domain